MILLNFEKTKVSNIKEILGLGSEVREIKVDSLFSDPVYLSLKELDISAGGGRIR